MTGQGTSLPATPSQRGHMRQKWQKDRGNQRGTRARRTTRGPERADRGGSRGARAEGARGEPGPRGLAGSQGQQNRPAEDRTRQKNPRQPEPAANQNRQNSPTETAACGEPQRGRQPGAGTGASNHGQATRATTHGHRQRASNHSRAPTTREQPLTGTDNAQEARVQTTHEIRTRVSSSVAHIVHSWNRRVPGGTHARLAARGTNREAVRVGDQRASPVRPDPVSYTHLTLPTSDLV